MGDNNLKNKMESYHDIYQKLNLSDDFLFSKVMQDEEILRLLLEKILKFPIKKVVLVQYQRVMEIDPGAHGIRLDVYAEALPVSLIRRAGLIQKSRGFSRNVIFQLTMTLVPAILLKCRRGMSIISVRGVVTI